MPSPTRDTMRAFHEAPAKGGPSKTTRPRADRERSIPCMTSFGVAYRVSPAIPVTERIAGPPGTHSTLTISAAWRSRRRRPVHGFTPSGKREFRRARSRKASAITWACKPRVSRRTSWKRVSDFCNHYNKCTAVTIIRGKVAPRRLDPVKSTSEETIILADGR